MPTVMNGRRSSVDIVNDILTVCNNGGVNKTAVMYRSNLSYDQLRRYLAMLSDQQLVRRNDLGHFQITDSGKKTLRRVRNVVRSVKALQKELEPVAAGAAKRNGHRNGHDGRR